MSFQLHSLPKYWRWVSLGEILHSIDAGKSFNAQQRPAEPGEWGVLKISAVTWGEFRHQENKALLSEDDANGIPTVRAGDLLISRANTVELVGAVAMAKENHPKLILCDKTLRLNPNLSLADPRYLLYALRTRDARKHLESHATGTSGSMRNITQANIRNTPIPLPPLEEQCRIAGILDKADAVRRKRKEAIALTEELLRSAFLDMFGNPVTNPKGWKVERLSEVCKKITDGTHDTPKRTLEGVPYITGKHIRPFNIDFDSCDYLSQEDHNEVYKRCNPEFGDILYTNIGVNLGTAAMCTVDFQFSMKNVALLKLARDILLPKYVEHLLNNETMKKKIVSIASLGGAQKFLSLENIRELLIPIPPVQLQLKFAELSSRASNHIHCSRSHEVDLQQLFNSLLQRAFRGEL